MPRILVVCNQKGGVGKTTVSMNFAATVWQASVMPPLLMEETAKKLGDPTSPVMVASVDPQQSSVWWSSRVERSEGGLPFDFTQIDDPYDLPKLRLLDDKQLIIVDTPGSLEDEHILAAALDVCDEVLVPMVPEPLAFDPTDRTIEAMIKPRGIPYRVLVNAWDPRDGVADLKQVAAYIRAKGWPLCNTIIRRYKVHTRASADGQVVTGYAKNRIGLEAYADFLNLAVELGYGTAPATEEVQIRAGVDALTATEA